MAQPEPLPKSVPTAHPKTVCRFCVSEMPPGALLCLKCKSAHGWFFGYKLGLRLLTLIALPFVAWLGSRLWEEGQRSRRNTEERRNNENTALETLMAQLGESLTLTHDALKAREALRRGCGIPAKDTDGAGLCLQTYYDAVESLDLAISRLSWQVDALALISGPTYGRLSDLKGGYWRSCQDLQPYSECGWRQQILRSAHGFGTKTTANGDAPIALMHCRIDTPSPSAERCRAATEQLRKEVVDPMDQKTNLFFCSLVMDINRVRMRLFQDRLHEVGTSSAYAALLQRLETNMQNSTCAQMIGTTN